MTVTRRLAAILAADVVGFSRLMEIDEAGTLAALKSRRKEVLEPLVIRHQGRVFKIAGDGVLAEFASAVNAVQCAVELQQGFAEANKDVPDDRRIVLRIGVNLGDVMVEGGDLYGDGVNIAARLEALAEPGGILVSGTAHDHVGTKVKVGFEDMGVQALRNIAQPVRAYRITGTPTLALAGARPLADKPSIAVLPFTNMSGDPQQQYFSDGITEDIITELSRFRSLFIIARNSSFQYRDKATDVRRVARELGVQYVVEGSVRVSGNRLRITAQLIDALSGSHLWAERYDRDMHDIFALQDELAHAVAATVGGRVEAAGRDRTVRLSPAGLKAHDLVLRGKASILKYSRSDIAEARTSLQRAIEIDPANAQAHAWYAHCFFLEYTSNWVANRQQALATALALAKQAVTLDDADTTAQWSLAIVYHHMRNFTEARVHYEKAFNLNPNDAEASGLYCYFLSCVGESNKAIQQFATAERRNPFDQSWVPWLKGIAYFTARRYSEAIESFSRIHEPINAVRAWLAASYAAAGRAAEARAKLEEFLGVAERDMIHFPGRQLRNWHQYLHGAAEYRDQDDFDHLFNALRMAGLGD